MEKLSELEAKIFAGVLKMVKPYLAGESVEEMRLSQLRACALIPSPAGVTVEECEYCGLPAQWISPKSIKQDKIMLYFHGGAYVAGNLKSSRGLGAKLANVCGLGVLSFEYRLAPESPYPAALSDAMSMYAALLSADIDAESVIFAGESAGGGLALASALKAKADGLPLPCGLVLMSPWTDLTVSGESIQLEEKDPVLSVEALRNSARMYIGTDKVDNPYISPVYGELSGLPPVLVQAGAREIILSDRTRIKEKIERAGGSVKLSVWEDMWHVFQAYGLPQSRQALEEIAEFTASL